MHLNLRVVAQYRGWKKFLSAAIAKRMRETQTVQVR